METGTAETCQGSGHVTLSSDHGFIAPQIDGSPMVGSAQCPWQISVGRRINITMHNFPPPPSLDRNPMSSSACYEVGSVKEGDTFKAIHKCLTDPREKHIYISNGEKVEVTIPYKDSWDTAGHFLLQYQGKIVRS